MPAPSIDVSSVPFVAKLSSFGDRVALLGAGDPAGPVTYSDLADRVAELAGRLGTTRRLVLVAGSNELGPVVAYLAALSAGHPVLLVPGDNASNLAAVVAAYDPDVVYAEGDLTVRREGSAHDLHPELALLLTTSGSTGSPKLVRLSHRNLEANAASIADYLSIRTRDVAVTTLPMHYCYGLSVINSHLASGAALLLTNRSVVDGSFWELFRAHGGTTFAGVPYTFELLDRIGFEDMDLPSLRYVTLAGGRLGPEVVTRYADLGRRRGWDLFVMYGQTEATARMAYLPPDLASTAPSSIGVPIPGGSLTLEPLPELPLTSAGAGSGADTEVGELVYSGENVMLGYADTPADLARGREVTALRTGDVARRTPDGLFAIVGRRDRFTKILGLRVDLDQAERLFADAGVLASCADAGGRLVVAVDCSARPVDLDLVRRVADERLGLPRRSVVVAPMTQLPRLPSGKPDYRAIVAGAAIGRDPGRGEPPRGGGDGDLVARLVQGYADVLNRPEAHGYDTFVTLGGDSLSYVEMSIRIEDELGRLPADWHVTAIRDLAQAGRPARGRAPGPAPPRRGLRTLETNVLLRALAILAIVGSHANLFVVWGGAHLLLGVAGFNFGRFHLTGAPRADRVRRLTGTLARIAVPSMAWITLVTVLTGAYSWQNVLLLNGVLGPREWAEPAWHYWFVEALVYILVTLTLLVALPFVDRLERRWSFWLPMALASLGLLTRYGIVSFNGDVVHRAHVVFWVFALGWATVKATSTPQRLTVSAMLVVTVPGFFGDPLREALVVGGLLALVWFDSVRVPAWVARACGVLAASSLYIYLAHWQVYPHWEATSPLLGTALSLLAGVLLWWTVTRIARCSTGRARGGAEIGEDGRWFTLRRYPCEHTDIRRSPPGAPTGRHDQPAHVPARPARDR